MKYFALEVLGEQNDDYCFTKVSPSKIGSYKLMTGKSLKTKYPADPFEITMELDEDSPGLLRTSFLGNTKSFLMMKKEAADFIKKFKTGEMEVFPFTLLDHKKRTHSKDYVFVNPLGSFECLNMTLSELNIDQDDGEILSVRKVVLDKKLMRAAPDLFRPKVEVAAYYFSEKLVAAIQKEGFSNFVFEELEIG